MCDARPPCVVVQRQQQTGRRI